MTSFEARYPGMCPACGERIKVGDPIADSEEGYAHDDCVRPERPPAEVCRTCFVTRPCFCEV